MIRIAGAVCGALMLLHIVTGAGVQVQSQAETITVSGRMVAVRPQGG